MTVRTLLLDGLPVSAREGETVLELCREHGVPLPTLCHHDGLPDVGEGLPGDLLDVGDLGPGTS